MQKAKIRRCSVFRGTSDLPKERIQANIKVRNKKYLTKFEQTPSPQKPMKQTALLRRSLYGSKWYLKKDSWEKSMQTAQVKRESLQMASEEGKNRLKTKLEFSQMLESMSFAQGKTSLK
jgi:hypothetical protein